MDSNELEVIRRSLAMAPQDGPATTLTNSAAVSLIEKLQRLEQLRQGVQHLLVSVIASRQNSQLRSVLRQLAGLLREIDEQ